MRLDTSLLDGISAAKTAATSSSKHTQKSSGSSFSSALKAATSTSDSSSKTDTTSTTDVAETTRAVPGHLYAEILTGPRAGMFINTSHNVRRGDAFVMVHRNGVELHVYGTGKNRHVVEMRRHSDPAPASKTTPDTSKTSTPTTSTPTTSTTPSGTTTTAGKIVTDTSTIS
jgi:hypothetical protein